MKNSARLYQFRFSKRQWKIIFSQNCAALKLQTKLILNFGFTFWAWASDASWAWYWVGEVLECWGGGWGWHRASPGLDEINWGWRTLARWRGRSRCSSHSSLQPTGSSLAARSPGGLSVTHFISKWLILIPPLPPQRDSLIKQISGGKSVKATRDSKALVRISHMKLTQPREAATVYFPCRLPREILLFWSCETFPGLVLFMFFDEKKKNRFIFFINLAVVLFPWNVRG